MPLPSKHDALQRIHELADAERVEVSRKARTQMDGLGYKEPDVWDMLYELTDTCWDKDLEESHWPPHNPTGTFVTRFLPRSHEEEGKPPDVLFVEVAIGPNDLYLLACKLDGSSQ
jgi:hypothetical protein